MTQFKLSVPLMAKLQNDSLRSRHWLHLMNKTGHQFSTDADKFRLSDMFEMNLYKHQVSSNTHNIAKQFPIPQSAIQSVNSVRVKWQQQ